MTFISGAKVAKAGPPISIKGLKCKPKAVDEGPKKPKVYDKVIPILLNELWTERPQRSPSIVHASDITSDDFCARRFALYDLTKELPKPEALDAALRCTFDVGKAMERLVRESWLRDHAVGHWKCRKCNKLMKWSKWPGLSETGSDCIGVSKTDTFIGNHDWAYFEVSLQDPFVDYSGSLDILLDVGKDKLRVVELKIMGPKDWEELVGPRPEHRVRTALYLDLIDKAMHAIPADSLNGFSIDTSEASILYVSRSHGKKNEEYGKVMPFKEFVVQADPQGSEYYRERAMTVAKWRKNKEFPARAWECQASHCKMANNCPMQKHCWSGKYN